MPARFLFDEAGPAKTLVETLELFNKQGVIFYNQPPMTNQLTFGQALEAVKKGQLIARAGWNGKGMFVFMRPADSIPLVTVIGFVKSLPQAVKDYYAARFPQVEGFWPATNVPFSAYLCMKAADDSIVNGWLASQTDMLAEDWTIVE